LSFNFDIYGNLWEQVCKFRAGRRLWAKILKEDYGAKNPKSMQLRMIAGGGGAGLTIQQPENNIMRGAYYALASALGGTQTMALCSYDEAYTIPTPKAAKLSLRTMQLLIHEIGLCDTVDPLAGSYFIETLTNEMEDKIVEIIRDIEKMEGGIIEGIATGSVQSAVNKQAYEREKNFQSGATKKVGINVAVEEEEEPEVSFHTYDEEDVSRQLARLAKIRQERDSSTVERHLAAIEKAAREGTNTMPAILDAVESYASVGEVISTLKHVYGTYQEPI
jgi:methylmalonyl-CoA mutase, N-terminal domain